MKHKIVIYLSFALVAIPNSCTNLRFPPEYFGKDPSSKETSGHRSFLACAVEFPPDYNWRRDSLGGKAATQVVLWRDTSRICTIPVSASVASGVHRIIGDCMYTDYCDGGSTVICCNSDELFRYNREEVIEDLAMVDGDIYTLGSARDGSGEWSFRRNGIKNLGGSEGFFLGGLHTDNGIICFAYAKALPESESRPRQYRYCFVEDGIADPILAGNASAIMAMMKFCGEVNYILRDDDTGTLSWCRGSDEYAVISGGDLPRCRSAGFIRAGKKLYLHLQMSDSTSHEWDDRILELVNDSCRLVYSTRIAAICKDAPALCFVHQPPQSVSNSVYVEYEGNKTLVNPRYRILSASAFGCSEEWGWNIAVCDEEDGWRPLIISRQNEYKYDFNGYFTCLSPAGNNAKTD